MCTAAEAKTLQRVYGRYNSFFRKVIPAKRMQKPVLWYTRLTVYGNPGRVVNGYAPGIPVLICVLELWFAEGGCGEVVEGTAFVLVPPLTNQGRGAAYFLRAYAGAPVTRTLRPLLAPHRRASGLTP